MKLIQKNFFLYTAKHTVIGLVTFLLTVLFLSSCVVVNDPGQKGDLDIMPSLTHGGSKASIDAPLLYGNTYRLTIEPGSYSVTKTADYNIAYQPATAFTGVSSNTNLIDFTVSSIGHETVTVTITHKQNTGLIRILSLSLKNPDALTTTFSKAVQGTTVPSLTTADSLTRDVLTPLNAAPGATLVKRYATETGAGKRDGSAWTNAWAATNLRNGINAISGASLNNVYLVVIAGGTYTPTYLSTANRDISFSMKNHVAIMGGFVAGGGWDRTGTTVLSGEINIANNTTDNSYHVFSNSGTLNSAHLYGVTITGGKANGGGNGQQQGAGMINVSASPVLTSVMFINNDAQTMGGGMYNANATPVLTSVVFSRNSATSSGGGMYNISSAPILNNTVFDNNGSANNGGGMHNISSSPVVINTVFNKNHATANGGGMYNDNNGLAGPLIVNSIFSGNTVGVGSVSSSLDIVVLRDGSAAENIRIAGSVLGIGLADATNGIVGYNGSASLNISYHHLKNTSANLGANATTGGLTYPPIQVGSSAINLGIYVKKNTSGSATYYFSDDNANWYSGFAATGGWGSTATLPANTEDLTATDIAGNTRTGRPDAGVYEF